MGDTDITDTLSSQMLQDQRVEDQFTTDARLRLSSLKHELLRKKIDLEKCMRASLKEAYQNGNLTQEQYEVHRAKTFDTQDSLEDEERIFYGQGRCFVEFFNDSIKPAVNAHINDMYEWWRRGSEGQHYPMNEKVLDQNNASASNKLNDMDPLTRNEARDYIAGTELDISMQQASYEEYYPDSYLDWDGSDSNSDIPTGKETRGLIAATEQGNGMQPELIAPNTISEFGSLMYRDPGYIPDPDQ